MIVGNGERPSKTWNMAGSRISRELNARNMTIDGSWVGCDPLVYFLAGKNRAGATRS